jgi:hypothetical protein
LFIGMLARGATGGIWEATRFGGCGGPDAAKDEYAKPQPTVD